MPNTLADFSKGQRVRYVPNHAQGNKHHPDCENGVVKSTNSLYVFVIYDNGMSIMITGDEPYTAAATDPGQLIHWS